METLILRTPSVGSVIKKMIAINPELSAKEMIQLIQQTKKPLGSQAGEFADAEVIDVEQVLKLTKNTLIK